MLGWEENDAPVEPGGSLCLVPILNANADVDACSFTASEAIGEDWWCGFSRGFAREYETDCLTKELSVAKLVIREDGRTGWSVEDMLKSLALLV